MTELQQLAERLHVLEAIAAGETVKMTIAADECEVSHLEGELAAAVATCGRWESQCKKLERQCEFLRKELEESRVDYAALKVNRDGDVRALDEVIEYWIRKPSAQAENERLDIVVEHLRKVSP